MELYRLDCGGEVIDTPGFGSFDAQNMNLELKEHLPEAFLEFRPYDECIRAVCMALRWRSGKWRAKCRRLSWNSGPTWTSAVSQDAAIRRKRDVPS